MSPMPPSRGSKALVPSNLYTAILAVALGIVLATSAFVAFQCFTQYKTIFGMP
jgi:biopolymer transport protein ExbB/TolQ